jgi:hypothetical protein
VAPMRRAAPRRRGGLSRSIRAALAKKSVPTALVRVNVKPRAPVGAHGHLHSKGHRGVTKGGVEHGYYAGTGFVERTIDAKEADVIRFIQEQPLDIEGASVNKMVSALKSF